MVLEDRRGRFGVACALRRCRRGAFGVLGIPSGAEGLAEAYCRAAYSRAGSLLFHRNDPRDVYPSLEQTTSLPMISAASQ